MIRPRICSARPGEGVARFHQRHVFNCTRRVDATPIFKRLEARRRTAPRRNLSCLWARTPSILLYFLATVCTANSEEFVRAGFTPFEAIQAATRGAAQFLGREKDFGTIEAGKAADLVLLDANPLENIANTRKILAVIYGGRQSRSQRLGCHAREGKVCSCGGTSGKIMLPFPNAGRATQFSLRCCLPILLLIFLCRRFWPVPRLRAKPRRRNHCQSGGRPRHCSCRSGPHSLCRHRPARRAKFHLLHA